MIGFPRFQSLGRNVNVGKEVELQCKRFGMHDSQRGNDSSNLPQLTPGPGLPLEAIQTNDLRLHNGRLRQANSDQREPQRSSSSSAVRNRQHILRLSANKYLAFDPYSLRGSCSLTSIPITLTLPSVLLLALH
jgi:hypothetical protein